MRWGKGLTRDLIERKFWNKDIRVLKVALIFLLTLLSPVVKLSFPRVENGFLTHLIFHPIHTLPQDFFRSV